MQHLVTNWHVDRNRAPEWENLWQRLHDVAQTTQGFYMARLLRSVEHPGKFTVYAQWESRAVWESYYELPEVQQLTRATFPLLKGPPIQEWFDVVTSVGQIS